MEIRFCCRGGLVKRTYAEAAGEFEGKFDFRIIFTLLGGVVEEYGE